VKLGKLTRQPYRTRWLALVVGGLVAVLVFPGPSLGWLAWFALVPGLVIITRAPTIREGWVLAWWSGAGYVIAAMYWMAPEIGPGLLLLGAFLGAFWIPYGMAAWTLLRPPITWRRAGLAMIVLPSCWLVTEWLRSWQALGGPWDVYGASQWHHPAVLALASIGGVWLVSFALVAANTALMIGISAVTSDPEKRAWGLATGSAIAAAVCVMAGPLAFALTAPFPVARTVTVALVQPGVINNATLRADASESLTARFSRSLGGVRPDLIVWGESSIAEDLTLRSSLVLLHQIEALSARDGAEILINQDAIVAGKGHEKWGVLVSPSGIKGIYVKTRLVPFGEYIPFRQQLGWLTNISKAASSNMVPGNGAHLLHATDAAGRPLPIGVLICFESAFPDMSRVDTDLGAQIIVYQSATSTFQGTWGPDQHASLAALRAAETGRPVVQAALTGVSAAFDGRGRLVAWMGQSQHGVTVVRLGLPSMSARTFYDEHGDYVPWVAFGVTVLMLARFIGVSLVRRRSRAAEYEVSHHEYEAAGEGEPRR
jgi:apolipoprotein N-acyltransferase